MIQLIERVIQEETEKLNDRNAKVEKKRWQYRRSVILEVAQSEGRKVRDGDIRELWEDVEDAISERDEQAELVAQLHELLSEVTDSPELLDRMLKAGRD